MFIFIAVRLRGVAITSWFRHRRTRDKERFAFPTPGKNTVNECSAFLRRIAVIWVWIFENAAIPRSIYGNIRVILEKKKRIGIILIICVHADIMEKIYRI